MEKLNTFYGMEENEGFVREEANLFDGEIIFDGLFDESDSSDLGDLNYLIVGDDSETIIPLKTSTPFEELHCAEYDKYMVPLFIVKNDDTFIGNGVIIGKYLVTAAHVSICSTCKRNIQYLYFRYEGYYVEINDSMVVFDGRCGSGKVSPDKCGNHDDLIVYELNEIYNSFKLSDNSIKPGDELANSPFRRDGHNRYIIKQDKFVCKVVALKEGRLGNQTYPWENCFRVTNEWFFSPGNSGSALFKKDVVYGILITANQDGHGPCGTVIEAKYIKIIIDKYEQGKS
ncbi:MAG: hypothetical protein K5920_07115 [Bacteroidales bacterium]|nr:hypothetical protein [Bacteroidales bacterium]